MEEVIPIVVEKSKGRNEECSGEPRYDREEYCQCVIVSPSRLKEKNLFENFEEKEKRIRNE